MSVIGACLNQIPKQKIVEDQTTDILKESQATDVPDASFLDAPKSNDPFLDVVAKSDQENNQIEQD